MTIGPFVETIEGQVETIKVGPDRVTITGKQVVIEAKHAMPDWQVREFSPIPIYFRDQKMFLRQKVAAQKPYAVRYLLEPWPEGTPQANLTFSYDAEAVAQRDAGVRGGHVDDAGRAALILFYPLLGLLWSNTKEKLRRFGFEPRSITGVSIFLVFGLVLLDGVYAKMLLFGSMKAHQTMVGGMLRAFAGTDWITLGPIALQVLWFDVILFVLLVLDVLIRYSQHLRDDGTCWGFCEWLTCLLPRGKRQVARAGMPTSKAPPAVANAEPALAESVIEFKPIALSPPPSQAASEGGQERAA